MKEPNRLKQVRCNDPSVATISNHQRTNSSNGSLTSGPFLLVQIFSTVFSMFLSAYDVIATDQYRV